MAHLKLRLCVSNVPHCACVVVYSLLPLTNINTSHHSSPYARANWLFLDQSPRKEDAVEGAWPS